MTNKEFANKLRELITNCEYYTSDGTDSWGYQSGKYVVNSTDLEKLIEQLDPIPALERK